MSSTVTSRVPMFAAMDRVPRGLMLVALVIGSLVHLLRRAGGLEPEGDSTPTAEPSGGPLGGAQAACSEHADGIGVKAPGEGGPGPRGAP